MSMTPEILKIKYRECVNNRIYVHGWVYKLHTLQCINESKNHS